MEKKFLLIDGSSLLHRAFFAMPPFVNSQGVNTGAVYGLCNMLLKLLGDLHPDYMLVAFDKSRKTFRTEKFPDYKGQRKPTPPELKQQFPLSMELLQSLGIPTLEADNFEADDIIGTLSNAAPENVAVRIVTGDRDELQLIKENVEVLFTKKGITTLEIYDEKKFGEEYQGLQPKQIIDLKGLMGDTSDNIPGVPGVGPKTALKLIGAYGSVENVLAHIPEIKGKSLKEKLEKNKDQALLSKELATICLAAPVSTDLADYALKGMPQGARDMLRSLEFKNMGDKFAAVLGTENGGEKTSDPMALFGEAVPAAAWEKIAVKSDGQAAEILAEIKKSGTLVPLAFTVEGDLPRLELAALDLVFQQKIYHFAAPLPGKTPLLDFLADANQKKAAADPKELYKYMMGQGRALRGVAEDPALAAYLYEPGSTQYSVQSLAEEFLPAPSGEMAQDAAELVPVLTEKLAARNLTRLYREIELPLTENLAAMEFTGIAVDEPMLEEVTREMQKKVTALEQKAWDEAGEEFNLNSPKQLGVLLFEKLHLPIIKKTKTGYSTDVNVLQALLGEHPLIETLLEYRQLNKLLSTYLLGLRPLINPNTGRIHTHFNQMATVTGRLSSAEPNLQNIPTRTEVGKRMREMFVPGEGYDLLMSCDYSQVELRVMASIAEDALLLDSFKNGQDVHARTASEIFGVPLDAVTPYMRSRAKTVNFGIIYGISDFGLARQLGVPRSEAADYIKNYFARYTGVKAYMEREKQKARELGYVETLFGRRRYLPDIKSSNFNRRSFAERTAINTPIQGTAADIIKIAMLQVEKKLREAGLKSRVLLQVHDELVLEVPAAEKEQAAQLVKNAMEHAVELKVPLVADVAFGENWARAK